MAVDVGSNGFLSSTQRPVTWGFRGLHKHAEPGGNGKLLADLFIDRRGLKTITLTLCTKWRGWGSPRNVGVAWA